MTKSDYLSELIADHYLLKHQNIHLYTLYQLIYIYISLLLSLNIKKYQLRRDFHFYSTGISDNLDVLLVRNNRSQSVYIFVGVKLFNKQQNKTVCYHLQATKIWLKNHHYRKQTDFFNDPISNL